MRRVAILAAALLLVTSHLYAQDRGTALGGVRFGAPPPDVESSMRDLRLRRSGLLGRASAFPQDQTFEGEIDGRHVIVFAMYDDRGSLEKMLVSFITSDTECLPFYRQFKSALTREFGVTHSDVEQWSSPYDEGRQRGEEETAIRLGKAFLGATWTRDDADDVATMSLSVEGNLTVTLAYESSRWPAELARRRRILKP